MKVMNTDNFVSERMKFKPVTNVELEQAMKELHKNPFDLTDKDLTMSIKNFPMGVVVKMLEEQEKQGNKADVTVFQKRADSTAANGGFEWIRTEDEYAFWHKVITKRKFDVFFEKYPEYEIYNLD